MKNVLKFAWSTTIAAVAAAVSSWLFAKTFDVVCPLSTSEIEKKTNKIISRFHFRCQIILPWGIFFSHDIVCSNAWRRRGAFFFFCFGTANAGLCSSLRHEVKEASSSMSLMQSSGNFRANKLRRRSFKVLLVLRFTLYIFIFSPQAECRRTQSRLNSHLWDWWIKHANRLWLKSWHLAPFRLSPSNSCFDECCRRKTTLQVLQKL